MKVLKPETLKSLKTIFLVYIFSPLCMHTYFYSRKNVDKIPYFCYRTYQHLGHHRFIQGKQGANHISNDIGRKKKLTYGWRDNEMTLNILGEFN